MIAFRHKDGSNQLGGYADTTNPYGAEQRPLTPQWAEVAPFGRSSQFGGDVPGPHKLPNGESSEDIVTALGDTEKLDDPGKIKAEYWADGPRSEFPPGHWAIFARPPPASATTASTTT